jgi:hypothetical protein
VQIYVIGLDADMDKNKTCKFTLQGSKHYTNLQIYVTGLDADTDKNKTCKFTLQDLNITQICKFTLQDYMPR